MAIYLKSSSLKLNMCKLAFSYIILVQFRSNDPGRENQERTGVIFGPTRRSLTLNWIPCDMHELTRTRGNKARAL